MKSAGTVCGSAPENYPPLIQAAVILKSSNHKQLAARFIDFIKAPSSARLMEEYGFVVPKEAASAQH